MTRKNRAAAARRMDDGIANDSHGIWWFEITVKVTPDCGESRIRFALVGTYSECAAAAKARADADGATTLVATTFFPK
jgi:hypothetical protein